ncbi:MAG TPA: hypothetical protein VKX28_24935 [Xanthobacteraceae bacterium]|nr:hypothetical protein [Xanthobacteraceae bacterium]
MTFKMNNRKNPTASAPTKRNVATAMAASAITQDLNSAELMDATPVISARLRVGPNRRRHAQKNQWLPPCTRRFG